MRKHSIMIAIATITGCLIVLSHGTSAQIASTKPMPKKWEYKVVHIKKLAGEAKDLDGIVTGVEASLNDLGASGWEVCLEINGGVILKR
ncbi:MAG TPA: hypothetical protein VGM98_25855 [Schlesneria sp.]|jgi:hypothetical protein